MPSLHHKQRHGFSNYIIQGIIEPKLSNRNIRSELTVKVLLKAHLKDLARSLALEGCTWPMEEQSKDLLRLVSLMALRSRHSRMEQDMKENTTMERHMEMERTTTQMVAFAI